MRNRPDKLIGVLGTHTEVGKTYVLSHWLADLKKRGYAVAARKPAQSFDPNDRTTDADRLACATGESATVICPSHRWYPLAYAPPMAADVLRQPKIALDELIAELDWDKGTTVGVVETVGGPYSPIAHDGDSVEFLKRLQPDAVILVADAGLGTLNAIRMALHAMASFKWVVVLNRYDESNELHCMNREWLAKHYGIDATISPSELTFDVARVPSVAMRSLGNAAVEGERLIDDGRASSVSIF